MKPEIIESYARLLVQRGLNVQPGQYVMIVAELDQPEFVRLCVNECYKAGAERVFVEWTDQAVTKMHCEHRSLESLSRLESFELDRWSWQVDHLPAKLYLESEDPDGLAGIDQVKYSRAQQDTRTQVRPYRDQMENRYQWCIAAVPGRKWAQKIFPDVPIDEAMDLLWEKILQTSRVIGGDCTDDPVENWNQHNSRLQKRYEYLNSLGLTSFHYTSSNGTDLTVGLNPDCMFLGGQEKTLTGVWFNPNIPSEEIFTSPMSGVVEGVVYSTKPLSWQGSLITDFWLRFENGQAVDCGAGENEQLLREMLKMGQGANKLGEVALVPYDSPINNTGILFYSTLFDENACCHLALGFGFSNCLKGFETLTQEQCYDRGINNAIIHVDFMIGSPDLKIVGTTTSGDQVTIFENGNWAF